MTYRTVLHVMLPNQFCCWIPLLMVTFSIYLPCEFSPPVCESHTIRKNSGYHPSEHTANYTSKGQPQRPKRWHVRRFGLRFWPRADECVHHKSTRTRPPLIQFCNTHISAKEATTLCVAARACLLTLRRLYARARRVHTFPAIQQHAVTNVAYNAYNYDQITKRLPALQVGLLFKSPLQKRM